MELVWKGVIKFNPDSAPSSFVIVDGNLRVRLDDVGWCISTKTLALVQEVRTLKKEDWPESWHQQLREFAFDLAADELVVYLENELEQRNLSVVESSRTRPVLRAALERLSLSLLYYLCFKTAREALDYRTRYGCGWSQVEGRTVNLLRGNCEKAIDQKWDTKGRRSADQPPSLLFQALHDILTGWGQRAFDEPMHELPLIPQDG